MLVLKSIAQSEAGKRYYFILLLSVMLLFSYTEYQDGVLTALHLCTINNHYLQQGLSSSTCSSSTQLICIVQSTLFLVAPNFVSSM